MSSSSFLLAPPTPPRNLYRRIQQYFMARPIGSPPMSPLERETLNPCEKLRRYGKIPWKLSVHTALVAATSLMVYMWSSNDALHIRHSASHFHRVLLGVSGSTPAERQVEIATSEDLKKQIDSTVEAYWAIGDSKLTDYSLCKQPLVFQVFRNGGKEGTRIELTADDWRSNEEYQRVTTDISSDVSHYSVQGTVHDVFDGPHWHQCLRWSLDTVYDYGGTGLVIGSLQYSVSECSKDGDTDWTMPVIVIALAALATILSVKAEADRRENHSNLRTSKPSTDWWFAFNIVANCVQIAAALGCMRLTRRMDIQTRFTLAGLAAVMAWIAVLRYLRYFHVYYVLVRTLTRAVPKCMRFVVGVSPILIGYALLGNCLFYHSAMFTTIGGSVATLFSLLNGDIIRDTFTDIGQLVPFWGELYLYSFLCLFIYVVLHIFISIVEESYFTAKHHAETPSEYYMHDANIEIDMDDVPPMTGPTVSASVANAANVHAYVLRNIKSEILFLRSSAGGMDEQARRELVLILSE